MDDTDRESSPDGNPPPLNLDIAKVQALAAPWQDAVLVLKPSNGEVCVSLALMVTTMILSLPVGLRAEALRFFVDRLDAHLEVNKVGVSIRAKQVGPEVHPNPRAN